MLDFLFAVGQFVCVVGLICGLILTVSNRRRDASPPGEKPTDSRPHAAHSTRETVQLAVLPPEQTPLIKVVPIGGVPARPETPLTPDQARAATVRRPRRRSARGVSQVVKPQNAALLTKHHKKKPERDGPRAF